MRFTTLITAASALASSAALAQSDAPRAIPVPSDALTFHQSPPVVAQRTPSGAIVVPSNATGGRPDPAPQVDTPADEAPQDFPPTTVQYDAVMFADDPGYSISTLGLPYLPGRTYCPPLAVCLPGNFAAPVAGPAVPRSDHLPRIGEPGYDPFTTGFQQAMLKVDQSLRMPIAPFERGNTEAALKIEQAVRTPIAPFERGNRSAALKIERAVRTPVAPFQRGNLRAATQIDRSVNAGNSAFDPGLRVSPLPRADAPRPTALGGSGPPPRPRR
ncbi:MAG: hypothetical protein KF745_07820 [Phycisphaeraceae bacterium]|nr:hypothetical protein [Phycisphaeraceae bacterium]